MGHDVINDLAALVDDRTVTSHAAKAFVCHVAKASCALALYEPNGAVPSFGPARSATARLRIAVNRASQWRRCLANCLASRAFSIFPRLPTTALVPCGDSEAIESAMVALFIRGERSSTRDQ